MTSRKLTQDMPAKDDPKKGAPDGVNSQAGNRAIGGASAGGPYPNPHTGKSDEERSGFADGFMGHGGQSRIAYHGDGQLGREKTKPSGNRNAGARED